jgi:hypothetical protein
MDKKYIEKIGQELFSELDKYFEIKSVKEENYVLRSVRRKIIDKFEDIINTLTGYLQPNSVFIDMHDARALDDDDQKIIVNLLKQFSIILKKSNLLEIESQDSHEIEFYKSALDTYKANIQILKDMTNKIIDAYSIEDSVRDHAHYLG